jgi:hypothetical protein
LHVEDIDQNGYVIKHKQARSLLPLMGMLCNNEATVLGETLLMYL